MHPLTSDERTLLVGYVKTIGTVKSEVTFRIDDIATYFESGGKNKRIRVHLEADFPYDRPATQVTSDSVIRYLDLRNRIKNANDLLAERKLIELRKDGEDGFVIALLIEGYDIGIACESFFGRMQYHWTRIKEQWWYLAFAMVGALLLREAVACIFHK